MSMNPSPAHFRFHAWRRAIGNFSLIRHRHCDGQLVSMHQSGTHWLKFMLANALSYQYELPPPRFNHANDYIGGPKDPPCHAPLPHLLSSHSIAHPWLGQRWLRLPRYVVLVRDVRVALVANYAKWATRYGVDFEEYLQGDPHGRRYNSDVWWCFRFLNSWGPLLTQSASATTLVRYEDLQGDPYRELSRVNVAWELGLKPEALEHGIAASDKSAMAAKDDPARPPGAVRTSTQAPLDHFDGAAREWFSDLCAQHLRYPLGYDYTRW